MEYIVTLLNNWLIQAIIGNLVCFILGKLCFVIYRKAKSIKLSESEKLKTKHSKKFIKIQFYVCFFIMYFSIMLLQYLRHSFFLIIIFTTIIFWSSYLVTISFEYIYDMIPDNECNRSK